MKKRLLRLGAAFICVAFTFCMTACSALFEEKDVYPELDPVNTSVNSEDAEDKTVYITDETVLSAEINEEGKLVVTPIKPGTSDVSFFDTKNKTYITHGFEVSPKGELIENPVTRVAGYKDIPAEDFWFNKISDVKIEDSDILFAQIRNEGQYVRLISKVLEKDDDGIYKKVSKITVTGLTEKSSDSTDETNPADAPETTSTAANEDTVSVFAAVDFDSVSETRIKMNAPQVLPYDKYTLEEVALESVDKASITNNKDLELVEVNKNNEIIVSVRTYQEEGISDTITIPQSAYVYTQIQLTFQTNTLPFTSNSSVNKIVLPSFSSTNTELTELISKENEIECDNTKSVTPKIENGTLLLIPGETAGDAKITISDDDGNSYTFYTETKIDDTKTPAVLQVVAYDNIKLTEETLEEDFDFDFNFEDVTSGKTKITINQPKNEGENPVIEIAEPSEDGLLFRAMHAGETSITITEEDGSKHFVNFVVAEDGTVSATFVERGYVVGDVLLNDGTIIYYENVSSMPADQRAAAVGVLYALDDEGNPMGWLGLYNSANETKLGYMWAVDGSECYKKTLEDLICTPSTTGSGAASTATFTGDTDGSNNWDIICSVDSSASEYASTRYSSFNYINNYASKFGLTGVYVTGWYMPSLAELCYIYRNKDTLNSVLSTLDGVQISNEDYWSSSQVADRNNYGWFVTMSDGCVDRRYKNMYKRVCGVRKFTTNASTQSYSVTISGGANATVSGGETSQSNLTGAMKTVTYTANSGYYFEDFEDIVQNGVTATLLSKVAVTVSGTPTANVAITIPDAVAIPNYSVSISAMTNGSVTTNKTTAHAGETVTLTVAPSTGYQLATLSVKDSSNATITHTVDPSDSTKYTFTMPAGNVTVTATFEVTYSVGDVLLNTGTIIPHANVASMTAGQKAAAVGVLYALDDEGNPRGWLGLYNSAAMWAPSNTTGYNTKFEDIICTPSAAYNSGTASTATFTGDTDGSNNWAYICSQDSSGTTNAVTNYPAFNYVNNYASSFNLTGDYATGWYMPSLAELCYIYRNKDVLNSVLTALEGIQLQDYVYWSSSQFNDSYNNRVHWVDFEDGNVNYTSKNDVFRVCCIHKFSFSADSLQNYPVSISTMTNGSVTTNKTTAHAGETVTFTVAPSIGYQLATLSVKDSSNATITHTVDPSDSTKYTFTMPDTIVSVTATFTAINYTVTAGSFTHGSVSATPSTAHYGDTITLTPTPATGYKLGTLTVKQGTKDVKVTNNTFTMPDGNVTVTATFTPKDYSITLPANITGGTLTANKTTAHFGDEITLTVAPSTGYQLATLSVKDSSNATITHTVDQNDSTKYTFTMPAGNVTVSATFESTSPAVTYSVGDVLLNTGTIIPHANVNTMTDDQKAAAVGVLYALDDEGNPRGWLGIYNSAGGNKSGNYAWAKDNTTGCNTKFEDIVCTPSDTGSAASTATFTGDTDGSNNWAYICSQDSSGTTDAATNYPAFNYVNNYASTFNLTGDYATGWYMPSLAELCYIYRNKAVLNSVLNALGGIQFGYNAYWSSSQLAGAGYYDYAWFVYLSDGYVFEDNKFRNLLVCCVHKFSFTDSLPKYPVSISTMTNGSVTTNKTTAHAGETVTLTVAPSSSYILYSLNVKDSSNAKITITKDPSDSTKYTFTMPDTIVKVSATFGEVRSVGDVLLNTGTIIPYANVNTMSDVQKAAAVGVLYALDENGTPRGWLGLYNSAGGTNSGDYAWAPSGTTGYDTLFDNIVCTPSSEGSESASTATFTGDTDGSDNWSEICTVDPTGASDAATNYPAFNYVNNYASTFNLTGDYATGWYMPSIAELCYIYRNKTVLNEVLNTLGGIQFSDETYDGRYWSSSQYSDYEYLVCNVRPRIGKIASSAKTGSHFVCCVRAF